MLSRTKILSSLIESKHARESYLRAKLNQLIPSQVRALRLREDWSQKQLGEEAEMKQARISAIETPGSVNFSLETLVRLAAAFKVGLQVRFVPYSLMRDWENNFSQDTFCPTRLVEDERFLKPEPKLSKGETLSAPQMLIGEPLAFRYPERRSERVETGEIMRDGALVSSPKTTSKLPPLPAIQNTQRSYVQRVS